MTTCPNCQTSNPDGARFCLNCGTKLALVCPSCGTELPAGASFCFNCGHRLSGEQRPAEAPAAAAEPAPPAPPPPPAPPTPAATPLDRFMPRELQRKLEAARTGGEMIGERRVVTMLFCDVKGSTAAAARFDPEDWAQIINGAFEPMIGPIYRYEGTVARLMGDGLLAFFGAPIAHEDDPQRAVLAGLEILAGIAQYRETVRREWGLDLDVRVGINTGLVVVGAVGSDLRMEYSALGDAINIAARMEQTAQPGTVQIAPSTYKLVAPMFDFETIDGLMVKGRDEPMTAYRVLGRKAAAGSLRGIAGLSSPLVGRDTELAQLATALATLRAGRGGIVTVMGEAGLGKSRLVTEARRTLDAAGPRWLEGKALSFETATPFAPFQRALSAALPDDAETDRYAALVAAVDDVLPGRGAEMAALLAQVTGAPVPPQEADRVRFLPPPMLRGMAFQAVGGWLEALAMVRPTVLYLDDVHWADPTSLELLHTLLPITDRAPLLVLLALRPRPQDASWHLHEAAARDYPHRYTPLRLQPLAEADSRALVRNLLAIEDLPETVRRLILDKSEGNPFFLEEVIRSLLDAGLVVRAGDHWRATREIIDLRVPDTLVGVITARLDRLDDASRQTAQAAAVLGREFSHAVLAEIAGQGAALEESLSILQRRDLIRQMGTPERRYMFKHALTQDAAYESLLISRRRHLHHMAGDVLRRHAPDEAAEIARHYLEARQPGEALPFLVRAAQTAAAAFATQEAITLFGRVLEHESHGDVSTLRAAYEGLAATQSFGADPRPAEATYRRMLATAEARGDVPMTVSALNKLGSHLMLAMGQVEEATASLERAERLSANGVDPSGFAEMCITRCQICTAQAEFGTAIRYMDGVIAGSMETGDEYNLAFGLTHTAMAQMLLNHYDEARAAADEALALSRRIGDRPHEIELLTYIRPLIDMRDGELDRVLAILDEGLRLSQRVGSVTGIADALMLTSEIHSLRGDYEAALAAGQQSLEAARLLEGFLPFYTVHSLAVLDQVYAALGEAYAADEAATRQETLRLLEHPVGLIGGGLGWARLGWGALARGDTPAAEAMFDRGLTMPTMMMNVERPRYLAGLAEVRLRQGQIDEARRLAAEARDAAEEAGLRPLYPLVRLALGRALAAAGAPEAARAEFDRAEAEALSLGLRPLAAAAQRETAAVTH